MNNQLTKSTKTVEELRKIDFPTTDMTLAEGFVCFVFDDIKRIAKNFFDIGARLYEAHRFEYQKELFDGKYPTIADLAEDVFGIKKTMAYSLMEVARKYCDKQTHMKIADEWRGYTQTQLIEMLPLVKGEYRVINERDTIADIKEWKRILKARGAYVFQECSTLKDCLSYARKLDELNIPKTNKFGTYFSAKDVQKMIEELSVQTEKAIEDVPVNDSVQTENVIEDALVENSVQTENVIKDVPAENSVQTENVIEDAPMESSVQTENVIEDALVENSVQTEKQIQIKPKELKETVLQKVAERIKFGGIKAYFDPDNKGGGTRFVPSALAEIINHFLIQSLIDNKASLIEIISTNFYKYLNSLHYGVLDYSNAKKFVPLYNVTKRLAEQLCDVLEDLAKVNE